MHEERPVRVALVLGSGGARGYAHIGVIQVLREAGVEIAAIAGSSMGAVIGGLHAAGTLDEYTDRVVGMSRLEVLRLMDVTPSAPGAIRGDRVFQMMDDLIGDVQIEALAIPFTAGAVDLLARREVWFQEGPLDTALRASTAIPSFLVPTFLNGRVLVDGGVLNPVPVAPVAATHVDHTIAVSLAGHEGTAGGPVSESADVEPESQWSERIRERAGRWFDRDLLAAVRRRVTTLDTGETGEPVATDGAPSDGAPADGAGAATNEVAAPPVGPMGGLRAFDVMQSSYDIMQEALTRHRLAAYAPDLLLALPKTAARSLDFHRAEELIEQGRQLAIDALPRIGITPDTPPVDTLHLDPPPVDSGDS